MDGASEDQPLERKVLAWLEEQGYPLELRTASLLRREGLHVRQSEYYYDEDSRLHREIDVVASCRGGELGAKTWFDLYLCLECKASPAKPWVLMADGSNVIHPR